MARDRFDQLRGTELLQFIVAHEQQFPVDLEEKLCRPGPLLALLDGWLSIRRRPQIGVSRRIGQ